MDTAVQDDTIVKTKVGSVKGSRVGGCYRWLGIPYGKPPVGDLRFRKTQPHEGWEGVREALDFGPRPPQPQQPIGPVEDRPISEDCLHINVWSPAPDGKKRPVLVHIYGGAFTMGAASQESYDLSVLAGKGDIVGVSFNYRVGVFGFMDFSQMSGAGGRFDTNCGMWDQIEALKWIRDNIEAFGGDPEEVTLIGQSAGGSSVLCLMAAPQAKGLFKRAISENAVANCAYTQKSAKINALGMLGLIGVDESDVQKLCDMPMESFLPAAGEMFDSHAREVRPYGWAMGPVVDNELLADTAIECITGGSAAGVPLLIGDCHDEASMFVSFRGKRMSPLPNKKELVEKFFELNPSIDKEKFLALYPDYPSNASLVKIAADLSFHIHNVYVADGQSKHAPVFAFRFDYAPPVAKIMKLGACHCAQMAYVYGNFGGAMAMLGLMAKKQQGILSGRMMAMWLNFIKHGDPNGGSAEGWPAYDTEDRATYIFNKTDSVENDPSREIREGLEGVRQYVADY